MCLHRPQYQAQQRNKLHRLRQILRSRYEAVTYRTVKVEHAAPPQAKQRVGHGTRTERGTHGRIPALAVEIATQAGIIATMMIGGTTTHGATGGTGTAPTIAGGGIAISHHPVAAKHSLTGMMPANPHRTLVDVQAEGWQWSYQLDEKILHSTRGRPYYKSRKTGKFLCAIQCTATHCNNMRPACNYSIRDPENDHHNGHLCSYCRQELEWKKAQHRARQDDADDP